MKTILNFALNFILVAAAIVLAFEYMDNKEANSKEEKVQEVIILLDDEVREHIAKMDSTIQSLENNIFQINKLPVDSIGLKPMSLEYNSLDLSITAFEIARFSDALKEFELSATVEILEYYEEIQYLLSIEEQAVQSFYFDLDQYQNLLVAQRSMVTLKSNIEATKKASNKVLSSLASISRK